MSPPSHSSCTPLICPSSHEGRTTTPPSQSWRRKRHIPVMWTNKMSSGWQLDAPPPAGCSDTTDICSLTEDDNMAPSLMKGPDLQRELFS
ncbi:hypothetical protein AOLI_G00045580 [Acnodon oligacanthus]